MLDGTSKLRTEQLMMAIRRLSQFTLTLKVATMLTAVMVNLQPSITINKLSPSMTMEILVLSVMKMFLILQRMNKLYKKQMMVLNFRRQRVRLVLHLNSSKFLLNKKMCHIV